jgi:hypothetical protein
MTLPGGSGGGSILNKLRNQNEDDIKNKLMQATSTQPSAQPKAAGGALNMMRRMPI